MSQVNLPTAITDTNHTNIGNNNSLTSQDRTVQKIALWCFYTTAATVAIGAASLIAASPLFAEKCFTAATASFLSATILKIIDYLLHNSHQEASLSQQDEVTITAVAERQVETSPRAPLALVTEAPIDETHTNSDNEDTASVATTTSWSSSEDASVQESLIVIEELTEEVQDQVARPSLKRILEIYTEMERLEGEGEDQEEGVSLALNTLYTETESALLASLSNGALIDQADELDASSLETLHIWATAEGGTLLRFLHALNLPVEDTSFPEDHYLTLKTFLALLTSEEITGLLHEAYPEELPAVELEGMPTSQDLLLAYEGIALFDERIKEILCKKFIQLRDRDNNFLLTTFQTIPDRNFSTILSIYEASGERVSPLVNGLFLSPVTGPTVVDRRHTFFLSLSKAQLEEIASQARSLCSRNKDEMEALALFISQNPHFNNLSSTLTTGSIRLEFLSNLFATNNNFASFFAFHLYSNMEGTAIPLRKGLLEAAIAAYTGDDLSSLVIEQFLPKIAHAQELVEVLRALKENHAGQYIQALEYLRDDEFSFLTRFPNTHSPDLLPEDMLLDLLATYSDSGSCNVQGLAELATKAAHPKEFMLITRYTSLQAGGKEALLRKILPLSLDNWRVEMLSYFIPKWPNLKASEFVSLDTLAQFDDIEIINGGKASIITHLQSGDLGNTICRVFDNNNLSEALDLLVSAYTDVNEEALGGFESSQHPVIRAIIELLGDEHLSLRHLLEIGKISATTILTRFISRQGFIQTDLNKPETAVQIREALQDIPLWKFLRLLSEDLNSHNIIDRHKVMKCHRTDANPLNTLKLIFLSTAYSDFFAIYNYPQLLIKLYSDTPPPSMQYYSRIMEPVRRNFINSIPEERKAVFINNLRLPDAEVCTRLQGRADALNDTYTELMDRVEAFTDGEDYSALYTKLLSLQAALENLKSFALETKAKLEIIMDLDGSDTPPLLSQFAGDTPESLLSKAQVNLVALGNLITTALPAKAPSDARELPHLISSPEEIAEWLKLEKGIEGHPELHSKQALERLGITPNLASLAKTLQTELNSSEQLYHFNTTHLEQVQLDSHLLIRSLTAIGTQAATELALYMEELLFSIDTANQTLAPDLLSTEMPKKSDLQENASFKTLQSYFLEGDNQVLSSITKAEEIIFEAYTTQHNLASTLEKEWMLGKTLDTAKCPQGDTSRALTSRDIFYLNSTDSNANIAPIPLPLLAKAFAATNFSSDEDDISVSEDEA